MRDFQIVVAQCGAILLLAAMAATCIFVLPTMIWEHALAVTPGGR